VYDVQLIYVVLYLQIIARATDDIQTTSEIYKRREYVQRFVLLRCMLVLYR